MNHDYWGPATEEEIEEEKLQEKYKEKLNIILHRNAGYFKANELCRLFLLNELVNHGEHLTKQQLESIDVIDFYSRNRDLGES